MILLGQKSLFKRPAQEKGRYPGDAMGQAAVGGVRRFAPSTLNLPGNSLELLEMVGPGWL